MSTALMGLCWPLQIGPTPKAVLMSLADQANDQGYCWPSMASLALRTCLSQRAVRIAVRKLEELGLVQVDISAMKSNRYILRVEAINAFTGAKAVESKGTNVADSPRHEVPGGTTCREERRAAPPAPRAGTPGTTCRLTVIEPIHEYTPHTPPADAGGAQGLETFEAIPETSRTAKSAGRVKRPVQELETWLRDCREAGRKPIPANDAVFDYAAKVGIDEALIALCWREFKRRHQATNKRQADWVRKFRNCVEGNWYGLWFIRPGEPAQISSKGEQARRFHESGDAQGEAA